MMKSEMRNSIWIILAMTFQMTFPSHPGRYKRIINKNAEEMSARRNTGKQHVDERPYLRIITDPQQMLVSSLMFTTLLANNSSDDKLVIFFLFLPENRF